MKIRLIILLLTFQVLNQSCHKTGNKIGKWEIFETVIVNRKEYDDPFREVSLMALFTGPGGKEIPVRGFYAGNNVWKIRFMPDQEGKWKYVARFSDGVLSKKGSLICEASDVPGTIKLYNDNPFWFASNGCDPVILRSFHAGDRFFADTSNFLSGEEWSSKHRSRFLDWLQEKGYNMLSVASHYLNRNAEGRGKGWNTPDLWDSEKKVPRPEEYDRIEKIMNDLAVRKIIVYPFAGFLGKSSDFPVDTADQKLYIDYTLSRLASYWNIVYNVAGPEPTLKGYPYLSYNQIITAGKYISENNAYGHLLSVHTPTGDNLFKDQEWLGFVTMQGPKTTTRRDLYEGLLRNHPEKKGLYAQETLWSGNKYHPVYSMEDIRKNAIVAFMAGAMINFADMNGDSSSGFSGSLNPAEANDGIHNVFHQVMDFFESTGYFRMKPHPECVNNGYCLASPGKVYLVYLENGGSVNIDIKDGNYRLKWINASDLSDIVDGGTTSSGKELTAPAYGSDWFVMLNN